MLGLRKYAWIGLTSARSNLAYLGEVATRVIFLGVILYIFLQLWRATYAQTGATQLGGLTLAQMLWYLAMTESIILSGPRVAQEVDQDVRTGALSIQLIRPLSYPLYRLWNTLGERLTRLYSTPWSAQPSRCCSSGRSRSAWLGWRCLCPCCCWPLCSISWAIS